MALNNKGYGALIQFLEETTNQTWNDRKLVRECTEELVRALNYIQLSTYAKSARSKLSAYTQSHFIPQNTLRHMFLKNVFFSPCVPKRGRTGTCSS